MTTVGDFLEGGHGETHAFEPCNHTLLEKPFCCYKISLQPCDTAYVQHMAAFRLNPAPIIEGKTQDTLLAQHILPAIEIYRRYPLEGAQNILRLQHEIRDDKEVLRIFVREDGEEQLAGSGEQLHCLLHSVPRGTVCWSGLDDTEVFCAHTSSFLTELADVFRGELCRYIMVTDGDGILLVRRITIRRSLRNSVLRICYRAKNGPHSLRHAICLILSQANACRFYPAPWKKVLHGVLNNPPEPDPPLAHPPRAFRDFDLFTLQRSIAEFRRFLAWKEEESRRVFSSPVAARTIFSVKQNAFVDEESVWRCPFPNPPIPAETGAVVQRNPRPRLSSVDDLLADGAETLSFRVTKVVRHCPDTFSQVFFGELCAPDGRVSLPVCLKLFVDVLFPLDTKDLLAEFQQEPPSSRLASLHFAEDLVRREEAAYDRLREHQGTLIPHCYGFHRFTLDDRYDAFGAILEIIPGPSLAHVELDTWSDTAKRGLVCNFRQCFRALRYAGVDQGDWHGGQILLPSGPNYDPEGHSLVLIDFAFALQRFGDEQRDGVVAMHQGKGQLVLFFFLMNVCGIDAEIIGTEFDDASLHTNEY
ncbi:hypothetical protein MKEN_01043600 [Mycena kentingensis (nom. inval.)]|nr:hypothetical protein MKEN_01043600 [Mycena kentingensis (nom. inval.)]